MDAQLIHIASCLGASFQDVPLSLFLELPLHALPLTPRSRIYSIPVLVLTFLFSVSQARTTQLSSLPRSNHQFQSTNQPYCTSNLSTWLPSKFLRSTRPLSMTTLAPSPPRSRSLTLQSQVLVRFWSICESHVLQNHQQTKL